MSNRAQVTAPYNVDMFTTLECGKMVTFEQAAAGGYYVVTPDNSKLKITVPTATFADHFKYYVQTSLF